MGQLPSTIPKSAGPPAVGPPAHNTVTMGVPTSTSTRIHTRACMHIQHTRPSWAWWAHTAPNATANRVLGSQTSLVLCFSQLQLINGITRALKRGAHLYSPYSSALTPWSLHPLRKDQQWGFPKAVNVTLLLHGDLLTLEKRNLQNPCI